MPNKSVTETDVSKGEIYSTSERWIIFIVIYVVSLIICIVYIFCRTDIKQFSLPIFVLCLIYSSFFVMLNVITMFDLTFCNSEGMAKFFEMISIYYEVFNWLDKVLGYIIFNLMIAMMQSGYFPIWKKFVDYWIKIWHSIPKNLIEIIIRLIIAGGILAILIIFRKRFDLENNPFDYFSIILDVFGMYEIYTNVGFFMLQLIFDYRRQKDPIKIKRYDRYSKIKIIEKVEKYMKKVKDSYNKLEKDAIIFEKNDQPDYHKYLQKIYKEMKEKVIEYGIDLNNEDQNLDSNNNNNNNKNNNINNNINININNNNNNINNNNNNINNNNNNNNINFYTQRTEINSQNNMAGQVDLDQVNFQNTTESTNDRYKKEDFDTSKNIRKFKNAVRRINKLKKLYKEIDQENKKDLDRAKMNKKCTCGFVILFIVFSIALLTDFFLPLIFDPEDDFTKSAETKLERFDSIGTLVLAIIVIYPFSVVLSSYTVIMIYSNNRKNYISGDYLYDKQINDNISLLKTVQIVCGYSFSILYCNIYFWRTIDTHGHYGKPLFYDTTIIPDYTFKQGITIFMIIKVILIVGSMIGSYYFSSCNIFQNDLGEFNKSGNGSIYDNDYELFRINQEKGQVVSFLYRN